MYQSTTLTHTDSWEDVCYPIGLQALPDLLLPGYELLPSDRQLAIVGEPSPGRQCIFALQSGEYSLVPNQLLREVATEYFSDHELHAAYSPQGEFTLTLAMNKHIQVQAPGAKADILRHSIILNNSYSGKTPLTVQGTALKEFNQDATELRMRLSYYRQVCSNGLMGWADDYLTLDEYARWLANGKPKRHRRVLLERPAETVEVTRRAGEQETEVLMQKKFTHKRLNLDWFRAYLGEVFKAFKQQHMSVTAKVYQELAARPIAVGRPERLKLLTDTGVPKMLARAALERLATEERELGGQATLWLAYNALNFALFNGQSSLTIQDRYRLDEVAFHHLAGQALSQ